MIVIKKLLHLFFGVLYLSFGTVIAANDGYDFVTDFSSYEEGDIPSAYLGDGLVVKSYTNDNGELVRYLTAQKGNDAATLEIKSLEASGEFEVILEMASSGNYRYKHAFVLSISNDETKIRFALGGDYSCYAALGDSAGAYCPEVSSGTDIIKLKIKQGVVKAYINSEFFQSYALEQPNAVFTKIQVSGLSEQNLVHSIKGKNLNGISTEPTPPQQEEPQIDPPTPPQQEEPPAPSQPDTAVSSQENQTFILKNDNGDGFKKLGESFDLNLKLDNFNTSTNFDIYVAVKLPSGELLFLQKQSFFNIPIFSSDVVPFISNTLIPDQIINVLEMDILPLSIDTGTYEFYSVTVLTGDDVLVGFNWLSNLAIKKISFIN